MVLAARRTDARSKAGKGATQDAGLSAGSPSDSIFDVLAGELSCSQCRAIFPILAGVAVLVEDVQGFLLAHVKGIMAAVAENELPPAYAEELKEAHAELQIEHIEDDLEAERVISLYLLNHYLSARSPEQWWRPRAADGSPLIDRLIREYWDQGPLSRIERIVKAPAGHAVELGCGVGGLALKLKGKVTSYLGVDSSFASIALARHLTLGAPYRGPIRIPEDLLQGPVSREAGLIPMARESRDGLTDFVVGELEAAPVARGEWDLSLALNAIDMLEEPASLPALQASLLKKGGIAIQSCPYIWHEAIAKKLRARLPRAVRGSAAATEWLYEQAGFKIELREDHVPWLFFKHVRQLELYSVHMFVARI